MSTTSPPKITNEPCIRGPVCLTDLAAMEIEVIKTVPPAVLSGSGAAYTHYKNEHAHAWGPLAKAALCRVRRKRIQSLRQQGLSRGLKAKRTEQAQLISKLTAENAALQQRVTLLLDTIAQLSAQPVNRCLS